MGVETNGPKVRETQIRHMNDEERAYVGAMIDAEGCVTFTPKLHRLTINVSNTSLEIISALLRATHVGRVYPYRRDDGRKQVWAWVVQAKMDALEIISYCRRYSTKLQNWRTNGYAPE